MIKYSKLDNLIISLYCGDNGNRLRYGVVVIVLMFKRMRVV